MPHFLFNLRKVWAKCQFRPPGALSIAASLASMVYALGSASGAHFNPAVTFAVLLSGRSPELRPAKARAMAMAVAMAVAVAMAMAMAMAVAV